MSSLIFFTFLLILGFPISSFIVFAQNDQIRKLADSPCPMNFHVLDRFVQQSNQTKSLDVSTQCQYVLQGLRLVQSDYLKTNGFFLPPLNSSNSCWNSYQIFVNQFLPNFDIRSLCGFQTNWISQGCMNITSKSQFETLIPESSLQDVRESCTQSLDNNSPCALCTTSLSRLQASYLNGDQIGNITECSIYPFIYVAALVNPFGPFDNGNTKCLFSLDLSSLPGSIKKKKKSIIFRVLICSIIIGFLGFLGFGFWLLWKKLKQKNKRTNKDMKFMKFEISSVSGLDSIGVSTTLIRFNFDEIKQATRNFSRHNIIGKGGYGNVYRGILKDGTEVAMKRFKNCSASGDSSFCHEVEVIASVRHINLVSLRGYCTATTPLEGHQRIIVCDLMSNGSLYDHLYNESETMKKLSWVIRRKIILGMARGLAYLRYGAQPAIIHRDIKASNILLDDKFEAKVADFGLAKFNPEGMTHLSTNVAGTMGYVAPEYILYGQLTERSDVYSFGVVVLEILSGKKAIIETNENSNLLLADWGWSLVKEGRSLDVIEEGMSELDSPEIMEKYVLLGVLCSHPQLYARPTMEQTVKILESDEIFDPSIPDRPIPFIANLDDIEKSESSNRGSGFVSSSTGYNSFTKEDENQSSDFIVQENSSSHKN